MKIRVLHYLRNLNLGGTEKTCQLFFEHAGEDFEVAVVTERSGHHPRLEEFRKAARVSGGEIFMVDSYAQEGIIDVSSLNGVIAHFKPDIFHVYRSGFPEYPEPVEHIKVPHFVETNVFGMLDSNLEVDRTLFMSKWLMNKTLGSFKDQIMSGPRGNRFDYVNNPVVSPYTDEYLPIKDQWPDSCIILGRVGRPDNGIYNAMHIEAAHKLRQQGYDVRFVVVAPPSNMVDDLANYEIPFYMVEPTVNPLILSQAYNTMDIYAHARADGETFGVNIAEAMIHGLPVVTHVATPSFPGMGVFQSQTELVDDGVTGYVVSNDVDAYARALTTLIDNSALRQRMGERGLEKAEREYHIDACMKKLERIYREVVNGQE